MNITFPKISRSNYFKLPLKQKNVIQNEQKKQNYNFSFCSNSVQRQNVIFNTRKKDLFFTEFLSRKGRVTKEEYEDIIKNHPSVLTKCGQYVKKNVFKSFVMPKELANIAINTNGYLKDTFENYRIVSIGTSPAALCEQLKRATSA